MGSPLCRTWYLANRAAACYAADVFIRDEQVRTGQGQGPTDYSTPRPAKGSLVHPTWYTPVPQFIDRLPPTVVVGIALGRRVEPWGFGGAGRSGIGMHARGLAGAGFNDGIDREAVPIVGAGAGAEGTETFAHPTRPENPAPPSPFCP